MEKKSIWTVKEMKTWGDWFLEDYDTFEEAKAAAEYFSNNLTKQEKKKTVITVFPDESWTDEDGVEHRKTWEEGTCGDPVLEYRW